MTFHSRLAALMLLPVLLTGCGKSDSTTLTDADNGNTTPELNEYQGEKLSSIASFQENSVRGPQHIDIDTWRLKIEGMVDHPREYTYDELLARERVKRVIWLHCVEGWSVKILWEGFVLSKLFDEVGVQNQATHALFYGVDGFSNYHTLNYIRVNDIMAATHANGKPLREDRGFPLQIIAKGKYGYKWCKWVTRIVFTDGPQNAGTYENSGYPRDGNVGESFYNPNENLLKP